MVVGLRTGSPSAFTKLIHLDKSASRQRSFTNEKRVYEESWLTMRHAILLLGTMRLYRDISPTA